MMYPLYHEPEDHEYEVELTVKIWITSSGEDEYAAREKASEIVSKALVHHTNDQLVDHDITDWEVTPA